MNIYLDCEFNGFGGELISMALVSAEGDEWYEVLTCSKPVAWVREHVMPYLEKTPITKHEFQHSIYQFLNQFHSIHIIADWPEDFIHLCNILLLSPGTIMNTPPLTMELIHVAKIAVEKPHNALNDARGLRLADRR